MKERLIWTLLVLLPKNSMSRVFGWLASREWPLFTPLFRDIFVKIFAIDMSEAVYAQSHYKSVQKLFVRTLKAGARPIADSLVVSPVDGKVSQYGRVTAPTLHLIQAKGKSYSLENLIGRSDLAAKFEGGIWGTIYLAPYNYHRIHSPVTGTIEEAIYIPGNLWPVNEMSIKRVTELFCVNERIITRIKCANGGECLVVKVGATNVGRITLSYTDLLVSNSQSIFAPHKSVTWKPSESLAINKGDELGVFELGSTVVVIATKEFAEAEPNLFSGYINQPVKMGQAL